ncbi:MAG: Pyrrolo-quinoline quinone beta-propeller repeat-containing protein [Acidobacteriaceae bacterium]|nr:Pyrrolo-quinoline quinone beta-propeller repeat-containing protein [Acidobacteriaceae bacterium]
MKCKTAVLFMWVTCLGVSTRAQESVPLHLVRTITMGAGVEGKFDHMALDVKGDRLFLTAPQHHTIEVFDLKAGKWMRSVTGLGKPAGIVYVAQTNQVLFSDGEPGSCKILDGSTYQIVRTVKHAADADSVSFDDSASILYVVNGGKDIGEKFSRVSAIDVKAARDLADIRIDGERLEAMAMEKSGSRLFVNVTALNKVDVIDRESRKVVAAWDVSDAQENVSIALDEADHRLFVATRKPGMLVVLDTQSGKPVAHVPAVEGVDDLSYDAQHKRIYMSGGEGFLNVYQQEDANTYQAIAKIPTGSGARTSKFVPEQNRLYVAIPAVKGGKPAEVQVYEVNP